MKNVDLLLINPPFHTRNGGGNFFPLGLGYIISSVEAHGHTWKVLDCTKMINAFFQRELESFRKNLIVELQNYSPLMIGLGPCVTSHLKALKIIAECCQTVFPSTPIVAGGPLASIEEQEWVFQESLKISYMIKGDGELAIPDAVKAIKQTGNIRNSLMVSRPGYTYVNEINDIDSLPFPYRQLHSGDLFSTRRSAPNAPQRQAAMITSRGCPYRCIYCVSGNLSQKVRKRSASSIVQEMESLNKIYGINDVVFYDDCFFGFMQSAANDICIFSEEIHRRNLHMTWQMEMRPDLFLSLDDSSFRILSSCGCRQINLGIEKVSAVGLKFLGKAASFDGLREKISMVKERTNISLSATFILGGRGETRKETIELINESNRLGLDFAHYNPLFVYPGTPLYSQVFDSKKTWASMIYNDILPWGEIVFENEHLKCADLLNLVDYAYSEFYKSTIYSNQQMISDRFNLRGEQEN